MYAVLIYGILYHVLISAIWPLLVNLIQDKSVTNLNIKVSNARRLFIKLWSFVFAGIIVSSLLNNYLMFYLFKTPNVFLYTNIFLSAAFLTVLLVLANVKRVNIRRFIALSDFNNKSGEENSSSDENARFN